MKDDGNRFVSSSMPEFTAKGGPALSVPPLGGLRQGLNETDRLLDQLDKVVERMHTELSPVVFDHPTPPLMGMDGDSDIPLQSGLAKRLSESNDRLMSATNRIQNMLDRLDI